MQEIGYTLPTYGAISGKSAGDSRIGSIGRTAKPIRHPASQSISAERISKAALGGHDRRGTQAMRPGPGARGANEYGSPMSAAQDAWGGRTRRRQSGAVASTSVSASSRRSAQVGPGPADVRLEPRPACPPPGLLRRLRCGPRASVAGSIRRSSHRVVAAATVFAIPAKRKRKTPQTRAGVVNKPAERTKVRQRRCESGVWSNESLRSFSAGTGAPTQSLAKSQALAQLAHAST